MNDLTVIIAIKNEGDQLRETLKSLRNTQDQPVNVLVINDASNDKYDYDSLCKEYDAEIITNPINLGTGPSKHLGTQSIKTKNFILIDGHMRFRNDNWVSKIDKAISDNPKSVLCTGCGYLDSKKLKDQFINQQVLDSDMHKHGWRGASFNPTKGYKGTWLPNRFWKSINPIGTHQIPTIMGASYCCNIDWYNHIGGLSNLLAWGMEEPFLSWKSWRFGGDARVILDVWIGHIWKTRGKGISFNDGEVKANMYINAIVTLPQDHLAQAMVQIHSIDKQRRGKEVLDKIEDKIRVEAARVNEADPDGLNFKRLLDCNELITNKPISIQPNTDSLQTPRSAKAILGLSVVIPIKDKYPENIKELINKSGAPVEVIIVNDFGDESFKNKALEDGCKYFRHSEPRGIATCISTGMEQATGTILCYLPNDFKITNAYWASEIYNHSIKAPRCLYGIGYVTEDSRSIHPQRYFNGSLDLKTYPVNHEAIVPSIPNTGFAIHKSYFRKLNRLALLKGGDLLGLNLSIKVWREGGTVKSLVGRYFDIKEPTNSNSILKLYDKLVTILTLIPESDIEEFLVPLSESKGFDEAMGMIDINSSDIEGLKGRLDSTLTRTCQSLKEANNIFRKVYGE